MSVTAGQGASDAQVVSLEWQRPQLVVGLQSSNGPLDPAAFGLQRTGRPQVAMSATGSSMDGDRLFLRFNVMVGPGLRPLEPGRWLLRERAAGRPMARPVAVAASVDPIAQARTFKLVRGAFRVAPLVEPAEHGLALDVSMERAPAARRGLRAGVIHRARRFFKPRQRSYTGLFALMKLVRRRSGRRVLFVSGARAVLGGNLRVVHDRMVERGLDRDLQIRTTFRVRTGRLTKRERIVLRWELAAADVIIVENSQQRIVFAVDLDPDVRVIQLWHASGAFKSVGYSRVGRPRSLDPWSRAHKNYTHAIVSSEFDIPFYAEAFGIPEDRVVPTGIPRMDRFFDDRLAAAGAAAALAAYPEAEGRMRILFAPTYRPGPGRTCVYPLERIDYAALHALCVEKDAVVIIRLHPLSRTDLQIPEAYGDRILDGFRGSVNVNDLLLAMDLLITDYSSIVFEFSTLRRPMLFYAFDLDEYAEARDLYVPFETFVPGRIVRTFEELLDAIRRDDYELEKAIDFAAEHFAHLDAGSTDRVIDQLILRR